MGKYRSIVLAKLTAPPTLQMVREMLRKIQELPGSTVQIPFGNDGSQEYSLSAHAISETEGSVCQWTLYRGENSHSTIEWTYSGADTGQVASYLTTRFPGWSQQSKLVMPEVQAFKKQFRTAGGARTSQRSTLEGDLADMPVTNLLQSVAMNKMNGRLEIRDGDNDATVWFEQGVLAHCELPGVIGDDALIELICWDNGEFYFFPETKIENHSVKKRLEILIMEGAIFHDLYRALIKLEFSFDSIVCRKGAMLQETEFDQAVSGGIPVNLELQKQLFCALNSKMSASELMQSLGLSKIQIVPIVFNLLSLDLIALENMAPKGSEACSVPDVTPVVEASPNNVDWRVVKTKKEISQRTASVECESINFAERIKEITGLNQPVQAKTKISIKGQKIPRLFARNLFQPVLLLLAVILIFLFVQDFQMRATKLHSKSLPSVSRPVSDKIHARKRSL